MFKWNEEYKLGVKKIDKQHKKLFEIGNKLKKLLNESKEEKINEILEIINELIDYTVYHFDSEEKYFEDIDFDSKEKHIEKHKKFVSYLENIEYKKVIENEDKFLNDLAKYISVWIIQHIKREDSEYIK